MTGFEGNERSEVTTREELVQRIALMEAMVAEGRRTTTRYGWMFLMWGVVYFLAMGWMVFLPLPNLAWPVCIGVGILIVVLVRSRQKRRGEVESLRSRNVEAVWTVMGIAASLFVVAVFVSHQGGSPTFVTAIMLMVGMAHATSGWILRWAVQAMAGAIWWGCGIAMLFFTSSVEIISLFLVAAFFGMMVFGAYAMTLERRRLGAPVQRHA